MTEGRQEAVEEDLVSRANCAAVGSLVSPLVLEMYTRADILVTVRVCTVRGSEIDGMTVVVGTVMHLRTVAEGGMMESARKTVDATSKESH